MPLNPLENPTFSDKPEWLDLPEEEKLRHTYWTCYGTIKREKRNFFKMIFSKKSKEIWVMIYHSQEEAEADACTPNEFWTWNGQPAKKTTLGKAMMQARSGNSLGVAVLGWINGGWSILKKYPKEIPLLGE